MQINKVNSPNFGRLNITNEACALLMEKSKNLELKDFRKFIMAVVESQENEQATVDCVKIGKNALRAETYNPNIDCFERHTSVSEINDIRDLTGVLKKANKTDIAVAFSFGW